VLCPQCSKYNCIIPFMNWMKQHATGVSILALILAITALSLNLAKICHSAEWCNVGLNALLAFSTLLLALAAFRALDVWKKQESRELARSLCRSTDHLVDAIRAACRQGEMVAKLGLMVVGTSEHPPSQEFLVDEAPGRISSALAALRDAKSEYMGEAAEATASWGNEFEKEARDFNDVVSDSIEKLEILEHQVPTLRLVIKDLERQEGSQYESLEKGLKEIPSKASASRNRLAKYLNKHLQL
jgi:hypothetical protein